MGREVASRLRLDERVGRSHDYVAATGPQPSLKRFHHRQWSPSSRYSRVPETFSEAIKRRLRGLNFEHWIGDPATKSAVQKQTVAIFQKMVNESLDEIERSAVSAGLFEKQRRRPRGRTKISKAPDRTGMEVFLWLAGYQTCGWSRSRLAEAVGVERNAVGMAINKLATALGIKLRLDRFYDKNRTKEFIATQLEKARAHEQASKAILERKD